MINQFTKARAAEIEEREGYKPGRKQMKEIKEAVTDELLPRAFAIRSRINAWIDLEGKWLVIDAASPAKADEPDRHADEKRGRCGHGLGQNQNIAHRGHDRLAGRERQPTPFTVDQDCELKSRGEQAATVRYVKHSLESEEIAKHIKGGKDVTKLAMTWADKVSFVLHENLQVKRVAPLDVIKEQAALSADDDAFDSDFALMTGELRKLIPGLINVLGGELTGAN